LKNEALVKVLYSAGPLPSHASFTFSGILSHGCICRNCLHWLMHRGHAPTCASALAPSLCHLFMTNACVVRDRIVFFWGGELLLLLYSDFC
jgi:hypothetical protein